MYKETKNKIKFLLLFFLFLGVLFFPVNASAQGLAPDCSNDSWLAERLKDPDLTAAEKQQIYEDNSCQLADLFTSGAQLINYLIGFIGVFVVFMIVVRGFQMVIYSSSEEQVKQAKKGITNAIIGLALVFLSYVAVNAVFEIFDVKMGAEESYQFPYNPFQES